MPIAGRVALPRRDLNDRYLLALCLTLAGYASLGKGVAYAGYPPLYIGEIMLMLGLCAAMRTRSGLALFASGPVLVLIALMAWVLLRTIPFVGIYGLEAVRDSVVAMYGLFAFVIVALLLEKPQRLNWIIAAYSRFAWPYTFVIGILLNFNDLLGFDLPGWWASGVPLVYLRLGEASVHLAGAVVFLMLGFRRVTPIWVLAALVDLVIVSVSRGAMLASLVPIAIAAILGRQIGRLAPVLLVGGMLFGLTYAADVELPLPGGRSIGPAQVVKDFESIFGRSDESNLDSTKEWRLRWWQKIEDYTLHGPYFWSGRGFGINLAVADGFEGDSSRNGEPLLRSPHNGHLTFLARAGVPGLALWLGTLGTWFAMMGRGIIVARRRGDEGWARLFLWIACYLTSIVVDASFDVALEGPMLGIWFWCLFGLGVAVSMIYRAALAEAGVGWASKREPATVPPGTDPAHAGSLAY